MVAMCCAAQAAANQAANPGRKDKHWNPQKCCDVWCSDSGNPNHVNVQDARTVLGEPLFTSHSIKPAAVLRVVYHTFAVAQHVINRGGPQNALLLDCLDCLNSVARGLEHICSEHHIAEKAIVAGVCVLIRQWVECARHTSGTTTKTFVLSFYTSSVIHWNPNEQLAEPLRLAVVCKYFISAVAAVHILDLDSEAEEIALERAEHIERMSRITPQAVSAILTILKEVRTRLASGGKKKHQAATAPAQAPPAPVPGPRQSGTGPNNTAKSIPQLDEGDLPGATTSDAGVKAVSDAEVEKLSDALASSAQVTEQVDLPGLFLPEGLDERPDAAKTIKTADGGIYSSAANFDELPLSPELLNGLYVEMKFHRPSRIQADTLPMILTPPYKDLICIAQAHNGSGKTTCLMLSMLSRVDPLVNEPQAVCVCPTRELVLQNLAVLQRMGKFTSIRALSTANDEERRRQPITDQVVVGTHGKLRNWITVRVLSLDRIRILVFDEADEMLKADGFADETVRIIKSIRRKNPALQLLWFSATFSETLKRFAMQFSPRANTVVMQREQLSLDRVAQYNVRCPDRNAKVHVLKEMIFLNCEALGQTIIFVRSKDDVRQLHREMVGDGYKCTSITGDLERGEHDLIVSEFRDGRTKILITTGVLTRGLYVSQVNLLINFDVPVERDHHTTAYETYLHRIALCGPNGRKGAAFNLLSTEQDRHVMSSISQHFDKHIDELEWDDEDKFVEALQKGGLAFYFTTSA